MRKAYLAFGVLCEILTFVLGLTFTCVGLGVVDVQRHAQNFVENLDSIFYRATLLIIGVAVMLVSLRIVWLLFGTLKNRRELTLMKTDRGVVKTTVVNLEKMLHNHLLNVEGVQSLRRVHVAEKKGRLRLYVTLVPHEGVGLETIRERINTRVEAFCGKYRPIQFETVQLDLAFEESA